MKKLALISVSDKAKIAELAKGLKSNNYDIIATGNTAKVIRDAGIDVTEVSDITGFPEIYNGRVKTLHPIIIGGILLRKDNALDKQEVVENNMNPIDVVCVNLYPFVNVTNKSDVDLTTAIENIDIGGPCLIRAAAKNYKYVSILSSPKQYDLFLEELNRGEVSEKTRKKLAVAAFSHTADYDTHIANYFENRFNLEPTDLRLSFPLSNKLRYGENPHQ